MPASLHLSPRPRALCVGCCLSCGALEVTAEFREALALIEAGAPFVFLSGKAGTGKSTFIEYLRGRTKKQLAVVAPTGLAALQVGGQTIHSFFRLPAVPPDVSRVRRLRQRRVFEKLELLVIDEVSMVRADLLDVVQSSLQVNRSSPGRLFGGVQIVAVGDLFQLPPVVAREEEERLLARRYASPYFFGAVCLRDRPLHFVELTEVFRQADRHFIRLLEAIREAECVEEAVDEINERCVGRELGEEAVILTATNAAAERVNKLRLGALPGGAVTLRGGIEGSFAAIQERLPAPLELALKRGAQVMFTKNDPERRWINGSLGRVLDISEKRLEVEVWDGSEHRHCVVEPVIWEAYAYEYDEAEDRIIPEVVGRYRQFPLRQAWAATIHKSQGLTLDQVLIDFGRGAFAPGQVYVALSRCRALSGISLSRPLRADEVYTDEGVKRFYRTLRLEQERSRRISR